MPPSQPGETRGRGVPCAGQPGSASARAPGMASHLPGLSQAVSWPWVSPACTLHEGPIRSRDLQDNHFSTVIMRLCPLGPAAGLRPAPVSTGWASSLSGPRLPHLQNGVATVALMDHWEGAVNLSHGIEHRLPADLSPWSSMSWRPHTVLRHLSPVKGQDLGGQGGMGTRVTDGGAAGPGVTQSPLCSDRPGVAAGGEAVPLLPRSAAGVAPAVRVQGRPVHQEAGEAQAQPLPQGHGRAASHSRCLGPTWAPESGHKGGR